MSFPEDSHFLVTNRNPNDTSVEIPDAKKLNLNLNTDLDDANQENNIEDEFNNYRGELTDQNPPGKTFPA